MAATPAILGEACCDWWVIIFWVCRSFLRADHSLRASSNMPLTVWSEHSTLVPGDNASVRCNTGSSRCSFDAADDCDCDGDCWCSVHMCPHYSANALNHHGPVMFAILIPTSNDWVLHCVESSRPTTYALEPPNCSSVRSLPLLI